MRDLEIRTEDLRFIQDYYSTPRAYVKHTVGRQVVRNDADNATARSTGSVCSRLKFSWAGIPAKDRRFASGHYHNPEIAEEKPNLGLDERRFVLTVPGLDSSGFIVIITDLKSEDVLL